MRKSVLILILGIFCGSLALANGTTDVSAQNEEPTYNVMDELNPQDPNIEERLEELDRHYEMETGKSAFPFADALNLFNVGHCYRDTCNVWAQVVKSTQTLYLYVRGQVEAAWKVSTGAGGYRTPNMDLHPNGRIYDRYSSRTFPGGDYKGLGNMPYAVFLKGGYAIHGTTTSNIPKLGRPASHGCIRLHPDNAYKFNRLVRAEGIHNVWVTVHD